MPRNLALVALMALAGIFILLSLLAPSVLSDDNLFLRGYIGPGLLTTQGLMLAVSLAHVGRVHLMLNELERLQGRRFLHVTRANLKTDAYFLVWLFITALLLAVVKPLVAFLPIAASLANGAGLLMLIWTVLVLVGITQSVFAIQPGLDADPAGSDRRRNR